MEFSVQICETREEFTPKPMSKPFGFSEIEKRVDCDALFANSDIDKSANLPLPPKKVIN